MLCTRSTRNQRQAKTPHPPLARRSIKIHSEGYGIFLPSSRAVQETGATLSKDPADDVGT